MYIVKMTAGFEKRFNKIIPLSLHKPLWRRINGLKSNPFIGKPLADALHAIISRDNDAVLVTRDKHFLMFRHICRLRML